MIENEHSLGCIVLGSVFYAIVLKINIFYGDVFKIHISEKDAKTPSVGKFFNYFFGNIGNDITIMVNINDTTNNIISIYYGIKTISY